LDKKIDSWCNSNYFFYDSGGNLQEFIGFNSTDSFRWYHRTSGGTTYYLNTNRLFRDVSAWYHILVAYDSTQATASNRVKFYVNGTQETSFETSNYPAQDVDSELNKANAIRLYSWNGSEYFNGYIAENVFCDGQALAPSDFGEFDEDSGIWKPIAYEGTYGTNGYFLEFKDSSALGDDTSGNTNDWTVNNLTSIDQTTDTPTNNFATLNPLYQNTIWNIYYLFRWKFTTTTASAGQQLGHSARYSYFLFSNHTR
jgi:hypothetical protein